MTPEQAAYRAGAIVAEAERRFGPADGFSPSLLGNCARLPARVPVLLRHVWPKVMRDAAFAALLDGFDPPDGPGNHVVGAQFWFGYYGQVLARELPPDFPAKLTALREAAGLSVSQLATAAGLHRQSVHQYENGERRPTWDAVQKLAAALHVPTDTFRGPVK